MNPDEMSIQEFVSWQNAKKQLFTPGPGSLLPEQLTGLTPCFGRNDPEYTNLERQVLTQVNSHTGLEHIVPLPGPASLALEVMAWNFLDGRVLVIETGTYSSRFHSMIQQAKPSSAAT